MMDDEQPVESPMMGQQDPAMGPAPEMGQQAPADNMWRASHSVTQSMPYTPASQCCDHQPTNATSYFAGLGAGAGSAEAHASAEAMSAAGVGNAFPPGSWRPRPAAWTS